MIIHVVQQGETIQSIAALYGVSEAMIIRDNALEYPNNLVVGETIIITFPELTYTVKEGDSLMGIADAHNVSVMQLLQNNPYLSNRDYIFPGDIIVISYAKKRTLTTHGVVIPFINKGTLRMTLPYLTYLSVLNYTATNEGEFISYYDDTEVIQLAKEYGTIPLMLLTTLTIRGEANIGTAFEILLNEDFQNRQIENVLTILKTKGYFGICVSFEYISVSNLQFVEEYYSKLVRRMEEEGFLVFAIINPNITEVGNEIRFARVDLTQLGNLSHGVIFMDYEWATTTNPPSPVSSIKNINIYLDYLKEFVAPDKIILGMSTLGYDWELPYSAGVSRVVSLTRSRAVDLARSVGAVIQFDDISQTPFFTYTINSYEGNPIEHIVWFLDGRTLNALLDLVTEYNVQGTGIWNIHIYNTQLWLVINTQYEIEKLPMVPITS